MKRILIAASLLAMTSVAHAQPVMTRAGGIASPTGTWGIDQNGNATFKTLNGASGFAPLDPYGNMTAPIFSPSERNFDTIGIDPNLDALTDGTPTTLLPAAALPCHQVGQVYVLAVHCFAAQATTQAETYGYSMSLANNDSGAGAPASPAAGSSGTDKVTLYLGGDENSSHSNLWALNAVVQERPGTGGVTGAEWDMNRLQTCTSAADNLWINHTNPNDSDPAFCPQFIGQWITGLNGAGTTGGPALLITGVGGPPLWSDGVQILGAQVRDSGFFDGSNSQAVTRANGTHAYFMDAYNTHLTSAAVRLMSGDFWGPSETSSTNPNGQGIFWFPGPATNGAAGQTDGIYDLGPGLTLNTSGTAALQGMSAELDAGTVFINPSPGTAGNAQTPYLQQTVSNGHLHIGQVGTAGGSLDVDGTVTANGLAAKTAIYAPSVVIGGTTYQPTVSTDGPTGDMRISNAPAVMMPAAVSSGSVTFGASSTHRPTLLAIGAYGSGNIALTPAPGVAESGTNDLGTFLSGGVLLTGDVMCQDGTDTASWHITATYLVENSVLVRTGLTTTSTTPATSGATSWLLATTADTVNSTPEIVAGVGSVTASCSGSVSTLIVN